MNKEEQIKTLTDDINTYLDFDGTCECVKEDGECHPNYQVIVETPALAKRLVNHGWNKTVWHKIVDGDLPENDSVVIAFYKPGYYGTKLYLKNADGEGWWYGKSKCKTEDIIAWTELPLYEE